MLADPFSASPAQLMLLQTTCGNRAVERLIQGARPGVAIQRSIDEATFNTKLEQEKALGITLDDFRTTAAYVTLISKIQSYNKRPSERRLKSVKLAFKQIADTMSMHFPSAHHYLSDQIRAEKRRLALEPKPSARRAAPREGDLKPKKPGSRKSSNVPPPLTRSHRAERSLPRLRPDFVDDDPEQAEPFEPPLFPGALPAVRGPMSERDAPPQSVPSSLRPLSDRLPAWRERPQLGDREVAEDLTVEEKRDRPRKRRTKSPVRPLEDRPSRHREPQGGDIPYYELVAARFDNQDTANVFRQLWLTAPRDELKRLQTLFSDREEHANLSGLDYVLEALDPLHRKGLVPLSHAAKEWLKEGTTEYFFDWLPKSKHAGALATGETVDYFDKHKRKNYELTLGKAIEYAKSRSKLDGDNIYAVSQANAFYATPRDSRGSGLIHHSSFLAGQAVKAAGHMVFEPAGNLVDINLVSGHYQPKPIHMRNALILLENGGVDLKKVKAHPFHDKDAVNAHRWLDQADK